jgi:hypothetical protein
VCKHRPPLPGLPGHPSIMEVMYTLNITPPGRVGQGGQRLNLLSR